MNAICKGSIWLGSACLQCTGCAAEAHAAGLDLAQLHALRVDHGARLPDLARVIRRVAEITAVPPCPPQALMCDP